MRTCNVWTKRRGFCERPATNNGSCRYHNRLDTLRAVRDGVFVMAFTALIIYAIATAP